MLKRDCPNHEGCAAPLCPLDMNPQHIWFPNEEICSRADFRMLPWVRMQRKLVRRYISPDGFFTVKMLEAITNVHPTLIGADPNAGMNAARQWLRNRRDKKHRTALARAGKQKGPTT